MVKHILIAEDDPYDEELTMAALQEYNFASKDPGVFESNPSGGFCRRGAPTPLISGFAAHASRGEGTPPTLSQAGASSGGNLRD